MRNTIIQKANELGGIPISFLEKKWDAISEAVQISHCITEKDPSFLPTVISMFHSSLKAVGNGRTDTLKPLFEHISAIAVAKSIKGPTMTTPPLGINPEAASLWKSTLKASRKQINSFKDPYEKWAAAIILFKRNCAKRGLAPFVGNRLPKSKEGSQKASGLSLLSSYVDPVIDGIQIIEKAMQDRKILAKNIPKFKLESIVKSGKDSLVTASKPWKLLKGETAGQAVVFMLPKFNVRKEGRNCYKKKYNARAKLAIKYARKNDSTIIASIELTIASRIWNSIQKEKKNPENFIKTWISRGFKATGSMDNLTVNANGVIIHSVSEDMEVILENFEVTSFEVLKKFLVKYPITTIATMGDVSFQIAFCKYLTDKCMEFSTATPDSYLRFLNDMEYREWVIEKYGTEEEEDEDDDSE
jgi:hypothetical protein